MPIVFSWVVLRVDVIVVGKEEVINMFMLIDLGFFVVWGCGDDLGLLIYMKNYMSLRCIVIHYITK